MSSLFPYCSSLLSSSSSTLFLPLIPPSSLLPPLFLLLTPHPTLLTPHFSLLFSYSSPSTPHSSLLCSYLSSLTSPISLPPLHFLTCPLLNPPPTTHSSELLADKRGMSDEELSDQLWVGKRFTLPTEPAAHSSTHTYLKKSIVPTHNIFQVGLSAHGACRLAYPWHGCASETNGFCNTAEENDLATTTVTHSLYDTVTQSDVKLLHREREAVLYHMPILGPTKITSHTAGSHSGNDYANTHFPKVLEALRIRKLDLLIDIGPYYEKGLDGYGKWIGFDLVYQTRDTMGALVPWFSPDQLHKLAE